MHRSALDDAVRDALRGQLNGDPVRVEQVAGRVWRRVETVITRPGTGSCGLRRSRIWRTVAAGAACLTVLLAVGAVYLHTAGSRYYPPGAPLATDDDYRRASQVSLTASLPAPRPFVPGFTVSADPVPACPGQEIELKSAEGWPGRRVWLYAAPASEQYIIQYLRKLPRDAVLIGVADIAQVDGAWQMPWLIPDTLARDGAGGGAALEVRAQSLLRLVGVTDSGYLAAASLEIGPERTLRIIPQPAVPGDTLTIRGSAYPANTRVRIDILHESPEGGTDLQANLGWAVTGESGALEFTCELPERLNWPYADSTGALQDHWLTVGEAGTYHILVVESAEGGPGAWLQKVLLVSQP